MIEYNKRQVYSFTVNGNRYNYFTINESDPYGDIIKDTKNEKTYFGKVDWNSGLVRVWSDRSGNGWSATLMIDTDSIMEYDPTQY